MDRAHERLSVAVRAVARFRELATLSSPSLVERDAAIKRFEIAFDACWKPAQQYLIEQHGLEIVSPKAAIRGSYQVGLLSDLETEDILRMASDRNLAVHLYSEALAQEVASRLGKHHALLERWVAEMTQRLGA